MYIYKHIHIYSFIHVGVVIECTYIIIVCNVSVNIRLKDCLPHCDSNVQELDDEWVENLPGEILVKHAVHMWHITVQHQDKLLQEGRMY